MSPSIAGANTTGAEVAGGDPYRESPPEDAVATPDADGDALAWDVFTLDEEPA